MTFINNAIQSLQEENTNVFGGQVPNNDRMIVLNAISEQSSPDKVIIIASIDNNKIAVSCRTLSANLRANDLMRHVASIWNGKGGGSSYMATCYIDNAHNIDEVLVTATDFANEQFPL